jgi:hypothetical protein
MPVHQTLLPRTIRPLQKGERTTISPRSWKPDCKLPRIHSKSDRWSIAVVLTDKVILLILKFLTRPLIIPDPGSKRHRIPDPGSATLDVSKSGFLVLDQEMRTASLAAQPACFMVCLCY